LRIIILYFLEMKTEILTLAFFVLILFSVVKDIYTRINFNKEITRNRIMILKHKDFKTYSIGNLFLGFFIILLEMMRFRSQTDTLNYLAMLCVVLVNIVAVFKLTNYSAIGEEGIWIDSKKFKWGNIESISKNEYGYSIFVKNSDHRIPFSEFENETESKRLFSDGIRRYNKIDPTKIKI